MKELLAIMMLVALSGISYAEQDEVAKQNEIVAQCTEQATDSGLSGEELDIFVSECAAAQSGSSGEKDEG